MDRSNRDRDNISQGGRALHTYTPQSHEDLLKSHLQIDTSTKAKLLNDVQRLTAENNGLRQSLDKAYRELQNKDDQIGDLKKQISNQPQGPSTVKSRDYQPGYEQGQIFEVDGKPISIDYLINHFNGVIKRHHDLLNVKNNTIQELINELNKRPNDRRPEKAHITTQSSPYNAPSYNAQPNLNDFTNELALVRQEYEHVERILTDRNNALERLIEDLQIKLHEYSTEIQNLRHELVKQEASRPSESTTRLVADKEREINQLREILAELNSKNQTLSYIKPESPVINQDLENQIRIIIQGREDAINKLNAMIDRLKKDNPSDGSDTISTSSGKPNQQNFEKECQDVLLDANNVNQKLNDLLNKLKDTAVPKGVTNTNDLISNLENLKKQCKDELEQLKNNVPVDYKNKVILRGNAVVSFDNPNYLKKKLVAPGEETELTSSAINTQSNLEFNLYIPPYQEQQPRSYDLKRPYVQKAITEHSSRLSEPESARKILDYPSVPCEACSASAFPYDRSVTLPPPKSPPTPSKSRTPPKSPTPTVKMEETKPRTLINEFYAPSARGMGREQRESKKPKGGEGNKETSTSHYPYSKISDKQHESKKPKGRGGCCGKKGSNTSYYPYSKIPNEEKVISVHSSYSMQENNQSPKSQTKVYENYSLKKKQITLVNGRKRPT